MLVLLNGGIRRAREEASTTAPLADACVTEWRIDGDALVVLSRGATR